MWHIITPALQLTPTFYPWYICFSTCCQYNGYISWSADDEVDTAIVVILNLLRPRGHKTRLIWQIFEYQIGLSIRQLVDYDCRQKTSLNDHLVKIPKNQYEHSELKWPQSKLRVQEYDLGYSPFKWDVSRVLNT